jgi:hypothetical protein
MPIDSWNDDVSPEIRTSIRVFQALYGDVDAELVKAEGSERPCSHDGQTSTMTPLKPEWGKVVSVSEIIESDVNGTFTYNVKFEKGIQSLVCGHDISQYPTALRKDIRWIWRTIYETPVVPHYLGDMSIVW